MAEAHRVLVVLDDSHGDKLPDLVRSGPVWIVDTPPNRAAAQSFWAANPGRTHLNGITTFKFEAGTPPEDILINELATIDLHHGIYSGDGPYAMLEVVGAHLDETLKSKLGLFGFREFQTTSEGFRATRAVSLEL